MSFIARILIAKSYLGPRTRAAILAPEATAGLGAGSVVVDIVRTDLVPPRHLSFFLEIPVVLPVTRGLT